jgi:NADPH:quinone reductase-like Zn-dependent oxidoreductase
MMTVRAIQIEQLGAPETLVERTFDSLPLKADEVRIRVAAAGVNFADLMMRLGLYGTVPPRPFSPGFEVAGEIVEIGSDVDGWSVGDRVVALMRYGGYVSEVNVKVTNLFPWPGMLSPAEAVALPVVFLTAWICLHRVGNARPGEHVLILGAGGGVGTAAVQLAKRDGLIVYGTAGTEAKRRFVCDSLGALACFDSRGEWESDVRAQLGRDKLDLALDPVGGAATRSCRRLLGPLGRLVFYGLSEAAPGIRKNWLKVAVAWLRTPRFHPIDLIQPNLGIAGVHLLHLGHKEYLLQEGWREMLPALAAGELRPVLDRTFSLTADGAAQAHRYLHERRNLGKVVLVDPSGGQLSSP